MRKGEVAKRDIDEMRKGEVVKRDIDEPRNGAMANARRQKEHRDAIRQNVMRKGESIRTCDTRQCESIETAKRAIRQKRHVPRSMRQAFVKKSRKSEHFVTRYVHGSER